MEDEQNIDIQIQKKKESNKWIKDIVLFLSSQAVSLFGSSLVQYAIIWYITLLTKSGVMTTISTLCGFVPQILISMLAGVWADRFNKKAIIMISDGAIALSTLIVAIFFLIGFDSIWLLFLALIIRSFGSGIQTPTVNSLIPTMVPEKQLMRINGINTTMQSIMMILSPIASAGLLAVAPVGYVLFIDVITALLGIGIFAFVKVKHEKMPKGEKVDYLKDIKEGLKYVKREKFIKAFMTFYGICVVLITPIAMLTPLLVTRSFGPEEWRLALNEIIFAVGTILGGIVISTWGGFKSKVKTILLGFLLCGIFGAFMGLSSNFTLFLVTMGLLGVTVPLFNSPFIVLIQELTSKEMYGRVFSIVNIIGTTLMPLAMVLFGPLADMISIEIIILITSILFIIMLFMVLQNKTIKEFMKREEIAENEQN